MCSRRSSRLVSSCSMTSRGREEAEAKELCDARVMEARHQLALLQVLAYHHICPLILHIYESFMEPLSSTSNVLVGHL